MNALALRKFSASKSAQFRTLLLVFALVWLATAAGAQGRGQGGPPGAGMGGMGIGGGLNRSGLDRTRPLPIPETPRGGLQLGPPGRWWDNKDVAKHIGLAPNQQHRMDDVFNANRDNLLKLYKNVKHEESVLQKMTRSRELDENQIFQQIDKVTLARGELEKANAHYLLQIRREMTPEQTERLDSELLPPDAQ